MRYKPVIVRAYYAQNGLFPVEEFRFCETRKWRFDFAFPDKKVALEVEGGVFSQGRHVRGAGFIADLAKYNQAASMGWRILRVVPEDLCMLDTIKLIDIYD